MRTEDLRQQLRRLGAKPCHESRVLRAWSRGQDPRSIIDSGRPPMLPAEVRASLPAIGAELDGLARVQSEHAGADGSVRLLIELADGHAVESVLLPRDGVCVSTQVGCAVACAFCMTGKAGLRRQLGSAEIVAQVVVARRRRRIRKVVFMGMGEPAHNLDNVVEAIDVLGSEGDLGHKSLVFSTVGDRRVFERLPTGRVRPALALSLHTTRHELRRRLLPHAPDIDPAELVARSEDYARATGYPVQYQWTLIEGVNDGDDEIDGIVRLLAGKYGIMNMIPFNRIDGADFRRPTAQRAAEIAERLQRHGILTRLRQSAGQDVEGACGQLRARLVPASFGKRLP